MIYSKKRRPAHASHSAQRPEMVSQRWQKPAASAECAFSRNHRVLGESQTQGNSFVLRTLQSLSSLDLFLLCGRLYSYPVDPAEVQRDLAELSSHGELLLFDRGPLIGFCQIRRIEPVARKATIASVYVTPDHRHQGIGRALMERAMSRCRLRNIRQVTLNVFECNPALELYLHLGFRVCGHRAATLPDGGKTRKLFMERNL